MKTTKSKDGTLLAYDTHGTGPALIYVTGASCFRNFSLVKKDVDVFAQSFTVYSYDRRGRGDSGNTLPYAIEREVEDLEAIIDAAGGSAYLYGHSSGAVLSLEAAMRLGDKVKKVVIYDTSYISTVEKKETYGHLQQKVHALLAEQKNGKAMSTFLEGIGIPKLLVRLMKFSPDWKAITALAPTLAYDMALTRDLPPVKRISLITVPTYILYGEKSPESIHETAKQITAALPSMPTAQILKEDHMVKPRVLLPYLEKFLKEN